MEQDQDRVADNEQIARIVSNEWVIEGELQLAAFALAPRETYLSVNRLCIDSYENDVCQFVSTHPCFRCKSGDGYLRALMKVSDVRSISFDTEEIKLNATVEVEPRDAHTRSHAGIFLRFEGQNVVPGRQLPNSQLHPEVSEESLLQQVQWDLLDIAELQECKFKV